MYVQENSQFQKQIKLLLNQIVFTCQIWYLYGIVIQY